jgi:nitrate reductase beta subunit
VLSLERRLGTRGLRVISVAWSSNEAQEKQLVENVISKHGMGYPTFLDEDGAWSGGLGLRIIPSFVVLDGQGKEVYRHIGKLEETSDGFERLANAIEKAMPASPQ